MGMRQKIQLLAIIWLTVCLALPARGQGVSLVDAVRVKGPLTFCNEPMPLDIPQVRERFEKAMMLALNDRAQVLLWIKRAPRYFPLIEKTLKADRMPDDLKYLSVAESALRAHAGSVKGAMGFWQLMPETARKYGLRVDPYIDERRNLRISTPAVMRYLQDLHKKFASWTLAAAAYNMGEEGLKAEILEQNTRDYYHLYLPLETQLFIFRVVAIKLILSDPRHFGFDVHQEDLYQPLKFDPVEIDCFQETPLRILAQAAGTYFKTVKDLNPQIRGYYLRPGHYRLDLPPGSGSGFKSRFKELISHYQAKKEASVYVVRQGDSLSEIAERFEVPLASLLIWNRIGLDHPIHPGDRLVIYPGKPAP